MRHSWLVTFAAISLALTGCGSSRDDRVNLITGYSGLTSYTTLTQYSDLSALVEGEKTFVVVITNMTCSCTTTFLPILEQYISATHVQVYTLEISLIKYQSEHFGLPVTGGETPILGIYEDGSLAYYKSYITNGGTKNKPFTNYDALVALMDAHVILPTVLYISKDELDAKFATDEKFILYYGSSTCPDCNYANVTFLAAYVKAHPGMKKIYAIDREVNGIHLKDGVVDAATWTTFKDNYGLSNVLNTAFGYATGFVPTFQYIEADGSLPQNDMSVIKDMCVVYNDTYDAGTYAITRTYFDGTRNLGYLSGIAYPDILGLTLTPTDDMHDAWAVYHAPFLQGFFDTYLPLAD